MTFVRLLLIFICLAAASCSAVRLNLAHTGKPALAGSQFYRQAAAMGWQQRDSFAVKKILEGDIPAFLLKMVPVTTTMQDTTGKKITCTYYVMPDYLSIGSNDDWARIPLTPMAAQKIADNFNCFLPTRKMVNAIYQEARVKLEPVPLFAFRDSTPTMYHHHLMIEGQRKGRKGLIAGIKKDVVLSVHIAEDVRKNRVAIYGWHKQDGTPIQPLYTGHVNWYVDYSHGIRLIYRKIKVNHQWMDYMAIMQHPVYRKLLCDETNCNFYRYPY